MAEVSRLASIRADRQKADFIGSISHEFRSPLHGNVSPLPGVGVISVSSCEAQVY